MQIREAARTGGVKRMTKKGYKCETNKGKPGFKKEKKRREKRSEGEKWDENAH